MTAEERDRRDSRALEPELITDPQAKAVTEARNSFRQYDAAIGAKVRSIGDRSSSGLVGVGGRDRVRADPRGVDAFVGAQAAGY
jgi:hypothetical protein